jgi:hydroxycarboxylate dehydrogenase B
LAGGQTQGEATANQARIINGMFSVLLEPSALGSAQQFEEQALAFLQWVQASPAREGFGPVQVAGDAERAMRQERGSHGVPVDSTTWDEILDAARRLGVDPAQVNAAAGL